MLDRVTAPRYSPPEFNPFPLPEKYQLDGGTNVYSFNQGNQSVFQIELIFPIGSAVSSNPAVPALCFEMLREGSTNMSAAEINHKLDFYGAFLGLKPGIENSFITLYGRSEFLTHLVPLLAEIVFEPSFNEQALNKQKKKMVQDLLIKQEKTSYWAPRLLRKNVFGNDHPYSKIITADDINKVSKKDLIAYHQQYVLPGLQHIVLAGSYNNSLINSLVADNFNLSYSLTQQVTTIGSINSNYGPFTKSLNNTTQASIAVGKESLGISAESYPVYTVLTKVLGGYFGSRLMKKLREEEGLTYGVYTYTTHLRGGSYLQIAADVTLNAIDKSIELVLAEVDKLKQEEVPIEELNTVKNYMLGEFVNNSNTVFDFVDLYKKIITQELKENYYESFYNEISSVTADQIYTIANQVFTANQFTVVKVS